ncbi:hypothetical protein NE237_010851 [Protea cynaroides]|uniref:Uncharacterized protein n=1 Tax=Protea cynaroides TaxID=273540 RepID=A0A9Q0L117_9MAGN|nr:hypothetical protein NE237_010851 [Protea cynaroides]
MIISRAGSTATCLQFLWIEMSCCVLMKLWRFLSSESGEELEANELHGSIVWFRIRPTPESAILIMRFQHFFSFSSNNEFRSPRHSSRSKDLPLLRFFLSRSGKKNKIEVQNRQYDSKDSDLEVKNETKQKSRTEKEDFKNWKSNLGWRRTCESGTFNNQQEQRNSDAQNREMDCRRRSNKYGKAKRRRAEE